MSLLDSTGGFPRDIVTIHAALKLHRKLYRWLQEEARKQGISVEQFIAHIVEEKGKETDGENVSSRD